MNTETQKIHNLHCSLVELRSRALQNEDKASYMLAHMMHNVPLMLESLSAGETDAETIISEIKGKSVEAGGDAWLQAHLQRMN